MTRQYIGARYVPIFSDVNNGVWDNSYSYEPLTIVKYGRDYYTSKKTVPVGTNISDEEYWVKTGDYNGAIQEIDERVGAIEEEMPTLISGNEERKKNDFNRPFNIMAVSDIHFDARMFYNEYGSERVELLINSLIESHMKKPIDALLICGDLTTDNVAPTTYGVNFLQRLYSDFINRLPFPVFPIAGNHDGYSNENWKKFTGVPREYSVLFKDFVFVMLDTFTVGTDPSTGGSGGNYIPQTPTFLKSVMDTYPDKKIIVCGHYFYYDNDTSGFKELIESDQVLFMVQGHDHDTCGITTYGTKNVLNLGQFSFYLQSGVSPTQIVYNPTSGEMEWSYCNLEMTVNGITATQIKPANNYRLNATGTSISAFGGGTVPFGIISDYSNYEETAEFITETQPHDLKCLHPAHEMYMLNNTLNIPYYSDLNDFTEYGVYTCGADAIRATLDNCPVRIGGFRLIVERDSQFEAMNSEVQLTQIIIAPASSQEIYIRSRISNTWGTWHRIWTDATIPAEKLEAFRIDAQGMPSMRYTIDDDNCYQYTVDVTGKLKFMKKVNGSWSSQDVYVPT